MDRKEQLLELIKTRAEDARRIAEAAESNGGYSAEDRTTIKGLLEEAQGYKTELDGLKGDDDLRRQLNDLGTALGYSSGRAEAGTYHELAKTGGLGAAVTGSDEYRAFRAKFPEGRIPDRARVAMDPVGIKELISITGTGGAQGLVPPDYQGLVDMLGRPDLHMRDLVSRRNTTSDLIEFVRQLTRLNNAGWVAEATTVAGTGGTKPMGGFDFEIVLAPVGTVAEWIPITKRALMDAAQLRGVIDDELRGDIRDAEELALLYGGGDIEGLDGTSGTQLQAFEDDIFVTARRAKSKVRFVGFATPTAYLINPTDDEAIDLARDQQGRFFGAGPFAMGPNTLWGLPRVVSSYVNEGEAWLADWRRAVIWDRQQATISVSDSHADFFVRNLVAVLGEQREAFAVVRPSAFIKIETAGPGAEG